MSLSFFDEQTAHKTGLMADQMNEDNRLINEVVYLLVPKSPKLDDAEKTRTNRKLA